MANYDMFQPAITVYDFLVLYTTFLYFLSLGMT